MLTKPRVRPDLRARVVRDDGVFLFGGGRCVIITDPLCERVFSLLDGKRTSSQIAEELGGEYSLEQVYFTLLQLEQQAYLCEADCDEELGFWASSGLSIPEARTQLEDATVSISAHGAVDLRALRATFQRSGLRVASSAKLHVAFADDYLRPELRDIDRTMRRERRTWLLIRPVGRELWLGPLLRPGHGACWNCLAFRLRSQRFLEHFVEARSGEDGPIGEPSVSLPTTRELAAQLSALEVLKYFAASGRSRLHDTIVTFDLLTCMTRSHTVLHRPQCECTPATPRLAATKLVSRPKAYTQDGGHRTRTPAQTLEQFSHLMSPLTGVVDGIEMISNVDNATTTSTLHVATAGYNFAFQFKNVRAFAENMRSRSAGKGMTIDQARAGALAEALERYSAIMHGDEPRVTSSYRKLARAIHPNECMLFSAKQYAERQANQDRRNTYASRIPVSFDEDAVVDWSPIVSLSDGEQYYLPTSYLYFSSTSSDASEPPPFYYADSNGNAAGNVLEEAVLQGFLELVERDCVAIWWYNRLVRSGVDLASFGVPYFEEMRDAYAKLGREIWVLDISNDLEIPAFAAFARKTVGREDIVFGFGCHLDPRLGVSRALTEMNQMLFLSFGENEDRGIARGLDRDLEEWFQTASLASEPYLRPAARPLRTRCDYADLSTQDLRDDIELCRSRVERAGLKLYILDQTRPDVGMPAVKVLVPGLRHFWPRFAPGRLYDVPVATGALAAPLREDELNPRRMFF